MNNLEKQQIKNELNALNLYFTEDGKEILSQYKKLSFFYVSSKGKAMKNRLKKERKTYKYKIIPIKINIKYFIYISSFWEKTFFYYSRIKNIKNMNISKIIKIFNRMLKKERIFPIGKDMLKAPIKLLPDFSFIFGLQNEDKKYYKSWRKKLQNIKNSIFVIQDIEVHHDITIKIKNSSSNKRKEQKIIKVGDNLTKKTGKFSFLKRIIDRNNNLYGEEIHNKETGDIIHECHEKLSEHIGHGSAKK
nr:hypothetical protein [uncultured Fusobacterium sp.]